MNAPAWPAMPYETVQAEDQHRGRVTQTHCRVTWIVADADGEILHEDSRSTLIHRSDDGTAELEPPYCRSKFRADEAWGQLTRYGGKPHYAVVPVLEALTDVNDDLMNNRSKQCVVDGVEQVKTDLDTLAREYVE
jgi:hypothetical protein